MRFLSYRYIFFKKGKLTEDIDIQAVVAQVSPALIEAGEIAGVGVHDARCGEHALVLRVAHLPALDRYALLQGRVLHLK